MTKSRKAKLKQLSPTLAVPLISKLTASPTLNGGTKEKYQSQNEIQGDHFHFHSLRFRRDVKRRWPGTPTPGWKLYDNRSYDGFGSGRRKSGDNNKVCNNEDRNVSNAVVSARKLAASLWELQQQSGASKRFREKGERSTPISASIHRLQKGCSAQQTFQSIDTYSHGPKSCKFKGMSSSSHGGLQRQKDGQIHLSNSIPGNGRNLEIDSVKQSAVISNAAMEKATKWDSGCTKTSDDVFRVYNRIKTLEEQQTTSVSVVSALQTELDRARLRVQQLEYTQKSSQKELDHFLKKIADERAIWQNKEQERIRAIIQSLKEELNNERKAKRRMEMVNGKLAKELAEAKMTIMRSLQDLEKERKARELMEDVCDELAREIGEDKAEVEELKRESLKVREEVEEERKMLQMAEVWREERVQMKLVEAKLALEEKSSALDKLREDLEAFINSRIASKSNGITAADDADMRDAELLREAASSVQIQDIKEFSYQLPTSDDIFSAFGDLHPFEVDKETSDARSGWDPGDGCYSPGNHTSKILTVSPEVHGFNRNLTRSYSDIEIIESGREAHVEKDGKERRDEEEEDSEWDYASGADEQGSCYSPRGSKPSVNGCEEDGSFSECGTDWEENEDSAVVITEIEAYSGAEGQLGTKDSSAGELRRSNSGKGEFYKSIPTENNFSTPPKNSISTTSPGQHSVEGICSPSNLGPWSSPDAGNPHIARGIKGFIEWPRGIQRNSLKARLLEAKMESQKFQLRHVLKQKH
eukprot:Gb_14837 [translate_table: standard]